VLDRVGQALLHHSVHGQRDAVRDVRTTDAALDELDRLAGGPDLRHQVVDGGQRIDAHVLLG
jgi:hypothetical protein